MDMNLTHIRLLVQDMESCHAFYKDTLGLEEQLDVEGHVYYEFKAGDCILALYRRELMVGVLQSQSEAKGSASDSVALTFMVPDVDAFYQQLQAKGVEFVNPPHNQDAWFLRVAHLRDPAGNLIEVNAPLQMNEEA